MVLWTAVPNSLVETERGLVLESVRIESSWEHVLVDEKNKSKRASSIRFYYKYYTFN